MKYRYYCFVCIFLLILTLFGCESPAKPSSPTLPPSEELSVVQIYNIVKDYDYWHYSFDGNVKAFKGDEEISLKGESRICDVQFIDEWIYYVKAHDSYGGGFDICRIRPNGEDSSVFFNSAEFEGTEYTFASFNSFTFIDRYMYIQASLILYQYDMLTKTITQIGDVGNYHIIDNQLYFIGHTSRTFTIYVMDLTTKTTKILLGDGEYNPNKEEAKDLYKNFIFIGNTMYYYMRSPDGLYSYLNGESKLITDDTNINEFSLFEHDNKLYYFTQEGEIGKLIQYNPKDEKITEVLTCNDFRSNPKIKDGYFYYLDSDYEVKQVKM